MNLYTAFRNISFKTERDEQIGVVLFDSGCNLTLMSENHPIISSTEISASKNQIKMQGAFKSETITSKFHINLNLGLFTKMKSLKYRIYDSN